MNYKLLWIKKRPWKKKSLSTKCLARNIDMKKYIFNRNEFTWAEEFYDIIKKKMELPDYFGCNADALWDMLTGYIDTPCEIVLVGFGQEENAYNRNFLQRIISCFEDAAKEYPEQFKLTKVA